MPGCYNSAAAFAKSFAKAAVCGDVEGYEIPGTLVDRSGFEPLTSRAKAALSQLS